jgi:hypothetical protein
MWRATAFINGDRSAATTHLRTLAAQVGFDPILPYVSMDDVERRSHVTPLTFFLSAEVAEVGSLVSHVHAIRKSAHHDLRFSPLIYFCETPSLEIIRRCIGMGFDDIIAAPFSPRVVTQRLHRQVGTPLGYFETGTYFGPDRRRHATERNDAPPVGEFRRYEIVRDLTHGISIDISGPEEDDPIVL